MQLRETHTFEHDLLVNTLLQTSSADSSETARLATLQHERSEHLLKLFAFYCRKEQDTRAYDVAQWATTPQLLQLMYTYAVKAKRERLGNKVCNCLKATNKQYVKVAELGKQRAERNQAAEDALLESTATVPPLGAAPTAAVKRITLAKRRGTPTTNELSVSGSTVATLGTSLQSTTSTDGAAKENAPQPKGTTESLNVVNDVYTAHFDICIIILQRKRPAAVDGSMPQKQQRSGRDDFFDSIAD